MTESYKILTKKSLQFAGLMTVILLLSFWIRIIYLNNFRWGYDEGIHVLLAQLLAAGYVPYSELFVSYPPVFVWSLEWPWRIWGTVEAIQLFMTFYALLGVAAVGLIGFRLGGTIAGVLAAIILSVSTTYLDGSRAVMTEVPSIGVAALAVALAALYYWQGFRGWLLASGLAMSISLMLKILSPFVLGLVPFLILTRQTEKRHVQDDWLTVFKKVVGDGFIWSLGLLAPILLTFILYDVNELMRQVITFRFDTRVIYEEDATENIEMLVSFVANNIPLLLATLWGISVIVFKQWRVGWFVLVWFGLALAFSMMQVPLRDKHLPLLLPPAAVLAGVGLGEGLRQLTKTTRQPQTVTVLSSLTVLLLFFGFVWQLNSEFSRYSQTTTTPLNEENQLLNDYLQQYTSPKDCLITDNPTLAFFANRLVPPNLSEVSSARLRTGYLTYDELILATIDYQCQVVAPVDKRLKRTRPDFVEWSKQNFVGLWLYDGSTEILLAQPLDQPNPTQPIQATLNEQVKLIGFDVVEENNKDRQSLYISNYWHVLQPFSKDYTIFVHLRDADNNTIVNGDHQPYNGLVPTSRWPMGQTIKETIRLDLPLDLPDGDYRIIVGMYLPDTLERLPVQNDTSGENGVILTSFTRP